jgi:hypothetical protein
MLTNPDKAFHFYLEVDRNNLIEDTLNQLIKPNINYAK